MTKKLNLTGKTVVITGASSGIGLACAEAFASEGCQLILLSRNIEKLNDRVQYLNADYQTFSVDVRSAEAVKDFCEKIKNVDILVNNAGLAKGFEKLHEGVLSEWEEMIDTNMKGLLYMTRFLVPKMLKQSFGHVIQIGSTAGQWAYPNGAVYCGSKAAVRMISESLRMDLVDTPVRVTNIQPGLCETEFSIVRFNGDEERAKQVYKGIEALHPEDVADTVVYAATAPLHVQIAEITLMPTAQASSTVVYRKQV